MGKTNWFISDDTKKHHLDDESWVEYRASISYEEFTGLFTDLDLSKDNALSASKVAKPLLKLSLVGWNLKGKDGKEIEFSKDKIDTLSAAAIMAMAFPILEEYQAEKKSSAL